MPGITGIIKFNTKKERIKELIGFLGDRLVHENWQKTCVDYDDNCGFEKVDLNEIFYPLLTDGKIVAGFYGQAVGYKDFETGVQVEINIDKSDEIVLKKIIQAYKINKLEIFIPSINGLFSFFVYDKEKNKLILGNDRYGLKPIYYRIIPEGIIFSSEIEGLVEIKQKIQNLENNINQEAIIEYFTFQHIFGTKTIIKEISMLFPASILNLKDNKTALINYWKPQFNKLTITKEEAIKELDRILKKAVKRRIPKNQKNIGISLSGGLDSRIILNTLKELEKENQFNLFSFNYGTTKSNLDSLFSKQLASLYNITHKFICIDYKSCLEKGSTKVGAEWSGFQFRYVPFFEEVRKEGIKDVFLGEFGDCSFGKDIKDEFKNSTDIITFSKVLFSEWNRIIPHGIQKQFFKEELHPYIDLIKENFLDLIQKNKQPSFIDTFNIVNIMHFERRHCGIIGLAAKNFVQPYSPYLDYDFQDFIYKLPLDYKMNELIAKKYIKEKLPLASSIPRNTLELFGNEPFLVKIWVGLLKVKHYFKPINMKAIDGKQAFIDNWEFIKNTLINGENRLWVNFFEEKLVFDILKKNQSKLKNWEIYLIDKLLSFELWLKKAEKYRVINLYKS